MKQMFSLIVFATLCLPQASGGLGILDPYVQQSALQLCWLTPLLLYLRLLALPISFLSKEILAACTGIQDHCLPFLLSSSENLLYQRAFLYFYTAVLRLFPSTIYHR
ncbi:hypothetical protein BDF14DRAFT_1889322 [Spinellus fusiger]|nr:hypothetical protein BDF14DRAFT_1889322 [Spinellus fusiger]